MITNHSTLISRFTSCKWTKVVNILSKTLFTNCSSIAVPLISAVMVASINKINKLDLKNKIKNILDIKNYRVINTAKKVSQSLLGQFIIGNIKENVLEEITCQLGSATGQKVFSKIGGIAIRSLAHMIVPTVILSAGCTIIIETVRKPINALTLCKILTIIAITGATIYAMPETLAERGHQLGTLLGSNLGELAGGILGGFVAIHLNGSSESLLSLNESNRTPLNNIARGYTFKIIQRTAFLALRDYLLYRPAEGIIGFISDLTLGSLSYNVLDIVDAIKEIKNGKLLDNLLPIKIDSDLVIKKETIHAYLTHPYLTDENIASTSTRLFNYLLKNLPLEFEHLEQFLPGYDHVVLREIYQELVGMGESQLFLSLFKHLNLLEKLKNYPKNLLDQLIVGFIRATNEYIKIIASDNKSLELQLQFNHTFNKWLKETHFNRKRNYRNLLDTVKTNLIKTIDKKIKVHNSQFSREETKTNLIKNKIIVKIFENDLINKIINQLLANTIDKVKQLEEKLIGIVITPEGSKIYLQEMLKLHAKQITTLIDLPSHVIPLQETEVRQFYLNMGHLLTNHYSLNRFSISQLLSHQILQAELKKVVT